MTTVGPLPIVTLFSNMALLLTPHTVAVTSFMDEPKEKFELFFFLKEKVEMAPQITTDVVAPSLHYEISHLWNGELIPQSPDHKINAQITLQSKKNYKYLCARWIQ